MYEIQCQNADGTWFWSQFNAGLNGTRKDARRALRVARKVTLEDGGERTYRIFHKTDFISQKAAKALLAACQEFVRKCECVEARSVRSYAQMKEAISLAKGGK